MEQSQTEHFRSPESRYAGGYPIKLVRDHVGECLGGEGTITYESISDEEQHATLLRRKLVEEAVEYLTDPSVRELADVLEVIWSLSRVDLKCPWEVVVNRAKMKRAERGGFDRGMVMVGHHITDGGDLLDVEVTHK
jgi:predicted house-cleaning noncanonical NTP pyrophosphatase (MazG superfamily)